MDVFTAYRYYTYLQTAYSAFIVLHYAYSAYTVGRKVKKFLFKEKKREDNWIELEKV